MQSLDVALITGSLRKESFSRKMGLAAAKLAPPGMVVSLVEIGGMQHYNEDLESDPPASFTQFRQRIGAADGVLFVTPEFNRGMPGNLKNAIDVGSRPYGQSVWSGKPCGVVSVSPGQYGAFGANHHIRQSFVFLDMPVLQQPEVYLAQAASLYGADGAVTDDKTRQLLTQFVTTFAAWVEKHAA
jgi:chromate reductase, NAD(P)H dehydrogenase (quinone)